MNKKLLILILLLIISFPLVAEEYTGILLDMINNPAVQWLTFIPIVGLLLMTIFTKKWEKYLNGLMILLLLHTMLFSLPIFFDISEDKILPPVPENPITSPVEEKAPIQKEKIIEISADESINNKSLIEAVEWSAPLGMIGLCLIMGTVAVMIIRYWKKRKNYKKYVAEDNSFTSEIKELREILASLKLSKKMNADIANLIIILKGQINNLLQLKSSYKKQQAIYSVNSIEQEIKSQQRLLENQSDPDIRTEYQNTIGVMTKQKKALMRVEKHRKIVEVKLTGCEVELRNLKLTLLDMENGNYIPDSKALKEKQKDIETYIKDMQQAFEEIEGENVCI